MKVIIDIRSSEGKKAGKGFYTYFLTKSLIENSPDLDFILLCKNNAASFKDYKNVEIKKIKGSGIFWHINVLKYLKNTDAQIYFSPSSFIVPAFIPKNLKLFVTIHDLVSFLFSDTHNKKAKFIEKFLINRVIKNSSYILCVSKNTLLDLKRLFKVDENKLQVINCSASDFFRPENSKLDSNFYLAVSTISPRKNFLNIVKSFSEVLKVNKDLRLKIVGNKGWQYKTVFEEIENLGISKNVDILGYVSDEKLRQLYNCAIALVFPSFYEGFGIPPLEAMKSGCPVISSNTSSLPEVVGDAAILIDPYDIKSLTKAMLEIKNNDNLRKSLILKGLNQSKKFSFDKSAVKLANLLRKYMKK